MSSLSIPKHQRPRGAAAASSRGAGRLVLLLLAGIAGYFGYVNRDRLAGVFPAVSQAVKSAADTVNKSEQVMRLTVRAQPEQAAPPVLTATGKIVSDHRVQVVTKVSGQIVELKFEQGDRVEKGQVLARIEDVNYRARRDEAKAMVAKARADVELQQFEQRRMEELSRQDRSTERELVAAKSAVEQALAQLAANEAALVWSEKALRDTEVVAPIAGVVLERNVEVGDFVAAEGGRGANANAQFASIADMTKLRVEIDISELDIARIRREMPCVITPDAYRTRNYRGRVLWIDPGANYAKATVQAKVRIADPDENLRVEGSAKVQFFDEDPESAPASAAKSVIWIPETAIRKQSNQDDGSAVFVVSDETIRLTPVTIGRRQGGQAEVLNGLSDGQVIVGKEIEKLSDGARVR